MQIRPVLLSGGNGTRLWPVSRKRHPKQFAELIGRCSLLSAALAMLAESPLFLPPFVVAQADHKFFILDALQGRDGSVILLEPCSRNTAAAVLSAALAEENDVLHLALPSDHVIRNPAAFFAAVTQAAEAARNGRITLFGVEPRYPETGYGYIRRGGASKWPGVETIAEFREKPDAASAAGLIAEGALWNSGIFLYRPDSLIAEAGKLAPDHLTLCRAAWEVRGEDLGCVLLGAEAYERLPAISFDHLIMEKTNRGGVVPCTMGWSDIGSWDALWQLSSKDEDGNAAHGPVVTLDTHNTFVRSDGPVIGVLGLRDVAVIATKDAVLVAPHARSQEVKQLAAKLEAAGHRAVLESGRTLRPWGFYEALAEGERFKAKHIVVKPGQSLSLQLHHHRAEHWVVVQGAAFIERDGVTQRLAENQSIYIPKGTRHRLGNPGRIDLHLVEVQTGDYLGEDDIVRFSDQYGRHAVDQGAEQDGAEQIILYGARKKLRRV